MNTSASNLGMATFKREPLHLAEPRDAFMSPSELQSIVQGTSKLWLSYVLIPLLSGGAAYFGAYLKRKGDDRAAREQFNTILSQLRQTTEATESIKVSLSSRTWLLQQQWGIREQHYAELLTQLTKFRMALHDQDEYFVEPYHPHDEKWMQSVRDNSKFQMLGQRASEANQALRELVGPASIFLSDKTIVLLTQMQSDHYGIANFSAMHLGEYVAETRKVIDAVYEAVLVEARTELAHHRSVAPTEL
jgi:hypothetical protein